MVVTLLSGFDLQVELQVVGDVFLGRGEGRALRVESVEPPGVELRGGALLHQAFGEYGHLHGPDSAGHGGEDLWLGCSLRVEVAARSVGVWGESGVDD